MKTVINRSSDAPVIRAYGDEIRVHLSSDQTRGLVTIFTDTTPPGGGPPPHFHAREDEWWFVLEGEAEFYDGGEWTKVAPGGAVFSPKGSLHAFRNTGSGDLKNVTALSPAGFDTFFRASEAEFLRGGEPDFHALIGIAAEHEIVFPTLDPSPPVQRVEPELDPCIVFPGEGKTLHAFGEEVRVMLDGAKTGGAFTMWVEITPPGGGPPPHWHEHEDEWFLVLEGVVSFLAEGEWTDAHPGDAVFAPRGRVHAFRNGADSPSKMLIHASPSGFEKFFAEVAEEFDKPGGPAMATAIAIAEAHGIHFVS